MRITWMLAAAFGLALVAGRGWADEAKEPKAIIEKAIAATGGDAKLAADKSITMKAKGTVHAQGMVIEWSGDFIHQLPKQSKATMEAEAGGQKFTIVMVFNGDKGWMKIAGNTMELEKDKLVEQQEQHWAEWVERLHPLVMGKGFTLSPLGDVKIDGKDAAGVKVAHKGHRDIELFFDAKTGLLVKSQTRAKDDNGQEVTQETVYRHFKSFDGVKVPTKVTVKHDGKDFLEFEVSEYKFVDKLDDSEFGMP